MHVIFVNSFMYLIWNERNLYDFFDEQGIYIEISVDKTMEAKFCYEISQEIDFEWNITGYSDLEYTRSKAEAAAFLKAFEILEEKLKQPKEKLVLIKNKNHVLNFCKQKFKQWSKAVNKLSKQDKKQEGEA